jgi:hypothetical protein
MHWLQDIKKEMMNNEAQKWLEEIEMGLNISCGKEGGRVGSYGWFHSFRLTVCRLEDDVWGSCYPVLQQHSDCDGIITPKESEILLNEIKEIKEKFKDITYPCVKDKEGEAIYYKYGEFGDFCFSKGREYGVNENGMFVFSPYGVIETLTEDERKMFDKYGKDVTTTHKKGKIIYFIEATRAKDRVIPQLWNVKTGRFAEELLVELFIGEKTDYMRFGYEKCDKVFGSILSILEKCAKGSIASERDIEFF